MSTDEKVAIKNATRIGARKTTTYEINKDVKSVFFLYLFLPVFAIGIPLSYCSINETLSCKMTKKGSAEKIDSGKMPENDNGKNFEN
jgi:hypothetical protein